MRFVEARWFVRDVAIDLRETSGDTIFHERG